MGAGVNENNQWEGNGNKTKLNLGLGMGMEINYWEWEGMGLKNIFPLISSIEMYAKSYESVQTRVAQRFGRTTEFFRFQ